jgi:predicted nucleic acid-binding protein
MFDEDLAGRILPFDSLAAIAYSRLAAARRRIGRPISHSDAQIASIAFCHGAALATRNTKDFADCGLDVSNPWER